MKIIKDGIIAFTRDGHLISFDSRQEYDHCDFKELNICHILASPHDLYEQFKELEETVEKMNAKRLVQEHL